MSRLETYGREAINTVLERVGRGIGHVQERKPLEYDLLESDDAYLVVFDAPGASKEDVQVRYINNELEVRIDRFREFYEGFEMRVPGRGLTLSGTAELPDAASITTGTTSPEATLTQEGTLHVRIPKSESARTVAVDDEESEEVEEDNVDADDEANDE
ncbi:Hsp20/alpha crystallin family protein [Halonotius terrestris]|uniref:Hsp20/alpha crystallin family protein n=1 Tax=Halonotius terrestris TaxID=2487750 RepID=A0A8J8PBI3_9EURY|nr:Hsp20 family protein [Halonotius terrestris]TQQ79752.1 Hsp20/alpha crystallin family protein [Halonotius terrestris]